MNTFTVGSLFAGIGGIELGLERTGGFKTIWQVEIDDYARRVLAKHWPDVRRWDDVRTFPPEPVDEWRCDLICGGFPCQDISNAGKRAGIDGERSGLWSEYIRVVRTLRPRYVLVENVAALLNRGMGRVLGDLAACGYDAEWECLPAAAFGAPHIRDRVFVLAYATGKESGWRKQFTQGGKKARHVANAFGTRLEVEQRQRGDDGEELAATERDGDRRDWWATEPNVGRVANGVPHRMDRLRCLGNAVVPQVAEWIGRRILEAEEKRNESASD